MHVIDLEISKDTIRTGKLQNGDRAGSGIGSQVVFSLQLSCKIKCRVPSGTGISDIYQVIF